MEDMMHFNGPSETKVNVAGFLTLWRAIADPRGKTGSPEHFKTFKMTGAYIGQCVLPCQVTVSL